MAKPSSSSVTAARTIGVVTGARSDYGLYRPILRCLQAAPDLQLAIYVTGMHLSPEFGRTIDDIERDGFLVSERIDVLPSSDSPQAIAKAIGLGVIGFGQVFDRSAPDLLLVLGDRFEMLAAALAALPFNIPMAHIHGGEATQGLIDEALRHSLTKMSHLHFVSTDAYHRRVVQLGEEPWRVSVTGAPGLDNLTDLEVLPRNEIERRIRLSLTTPPLLVAFHPETLGYGAVAAHIEQVLLAIDASCLPVVFTYPNADTNGRQIIDAINAYVGSHENARAVASLGTQAYFSLMRHSAALVGNSSSGIIEAASFELAVVNIGSRQQGRVRGPNVIDVECTQQAIEEGIRQATTPAFRQSLSGMKNVYGDGRAAQKIVERLRSVELNRELLVKRFHDLPDGSQAECA